MSGSRRKASSPTWRARCRRRSRSSGSSLPADARQLPRVAVRRRATRAESPATSRASSSPSPALTSAEATATASDTERTEWSSRRPASQIGYHSAWARAAISGRPSCTRTRSTSPCGGGSRRPRLPTATSARPSVPVRGGGAPRRCLGGGVPAAAPASRPVNHVSSAATRSVRESAGNAPVSSTVPLPEAGSASAGAGGEPLPRPMRWSILRGLQSVVPALAGADADDLVDRRHPHLAVTDLAGGGGLHDRVDDPGGVQLADDDLDPDLRHEVHLVLRAAVDLGVPPLAAEPLDLRDREPGDADQLQGVLDVVELERLDDRGDQLHARTPSVFLASACAWPMSDVP